MALNKEQLKDGIRQAFVTAKAKENDADSVFDKLASDIADAVDQYIKQMQITYTAGLAAPNGAVTGNFGYTLS